MRCKAGLNITFPQLFQSSECACRKAPNPRPRPPRLQSPFFGVVYVKEEADFVWFGAKLRNIRFVIFLIAIRQLADEFALQFVVPSDNTHSLFEFGCRFEPVADLIITRSGRHKILILVCANARELPEKGRKPARLKIIFAIRPNQKRATLIERTGGDNIAPKFFMRAARRLLAQIRSKRLKFRLIHTTSNCRNLFARFPLCKGKRIPLTCQKGT